MSGPGLRNVDSHAAIHEAALNEAIELNDLLDKLLKDEQIEKGLEVAHIAVEHWETRTLRHAQAEEEGLYIEMVKEKPELKEGVIGLIRDHDILRFLVKEIKKILDTLIDGTIPHIQTEGQAVFNELVKHGDEYFTMLDLQSFIEAQKKADQLYALKNEWYRKSLLNIASSGSFSSDYTIKRYAEEIWDITPIR